MSKFQNFTLSDFQTPSDYSALSAPTLTPASEDLCLKEGRKSSISGHRKQRMNSGTQWMKINQNHVSGQKNHDFMKNLTLNFH